MIIKIIKQRNFYNNLLYLKLIYHEIYYKKEKVKNSIVKLSDDKKELNKLKKFNRLLLGYKNLLTNI